MKAKISIVVIGIVVATLNSLNGQEPTLPSRNPEIVLPLLFPFDETRCYNEIESILGLPDNDIGSGIYILFFQLKDSTDIIVGTPDKDTVWYMHHVVTRTDSTECNDPFEPNKSLKRTPRRPVHKSKVGSGAA